jgi:glycosyltransferase involved in cell wall biosynthesis
MIASNENFPKKPRVAVAQIGARMHYAVPTVLHRAGILEVLHTDLCAEAGWVRTMKNVVPNNLLPSSAKRLLGRRAPEVPRDRINCFSLYGLTRILQRGRVRSPAQMFRHLLDANESFGKRVARHGLGGCDVLYTFNGASLEILRYAKLHSIKTVLEQISAPIGFDERLLAEERKRWPGWEFDGASEIDWQPLAKREKQEWELADAIACGSQYVVDAIQSERGPVHKCVVVPYGVEFQNAPSQSRARNERLRVLCVATLQLRKGVQYLIEVARLLRDEPVEIRLIGPVQISDEALNELKQAVTVVGQISRQQMCDDYAQADMLILPSISEGSATVCYEALASGLPVITTPNAGSVVRDGVDGFIVPIRDPKSMANRISSLSRDRDQLDAMKRNAVASAQNYTWECYGRRLVELIQKM